MHWVRGVMGDIGTLLLHTWPVFVIYISQVVLFRFLIARRQVRMFPPVVMDAQDQTGCSDLDKRPPRARRIGVVGGRDVARNRFGRLGQL